jgi:hypothetical protein
MIDFEIGTAGFIGSKKDWLSMPNINCLEINSTFYRLPTLKTISNFKSLVSSSAADDVNLVFSVKVSRFITHMKRLHNCRAAFRKFWTAIRPLSPHLQVILFQFPPSFKYNEQNMQRLKQLDYLGEIMKIKQSKSIQIVFEFRDNSWFEGGGGQGREDVVSLFKSRGWTLGGTWIDKKKDGKWMGTMPGGLHLPEKTSDPHLMLPVCIPQPSPIRPQPPPRLRSARIPPLSLNPLYIGNPEMSEKTTNGLYKFIAFYRAKIQFILFTIYCI